ncbi:MAG: FtsW/RodA/SpoVE family cell cycle protein [Lachnospiraceae bacterium]
MFKKYKIKYYNFRLLFVVLLASVMGVLAVGSADPTYQNKQMLGAIAGIIIMIIVSLISYNFILKFYWVIYLVNALLLAATYTNFGDSTNGAQRWLKFGGITFQPSETAKLLLILFFAQFIMLNRKSINHILKLSLTCILFLVPALLIYKQPDLSTTLVIVTIFCVMLFVGGISWKYILTVASILLPVVLVFVFLAIQPEATLLENHQKERILAFINPEEYSDSTAYQQLNSVLAIASGQLEGKGYMNNEVTSVKNGQYILEPHTDFIFAVIGEEFGYYGSIAVVTVLFSIVLECLYVAYKAKDISGQLVAAGMAAWIGFQSFFNLGVATFILPNTGLPLPFISYGLTSLWSLYLGIGVVLNINLQQRRK